MTTNRTRYELIIPGHKDNRAVRNRCSGELRANTPTTTPPPVPAAPALAPPELGSGCRGVWDATLGALSPALALDLVPGAGEGFDDGRVAELLAQFHDGDADGVGEGVRV